MKNELLKNKALSVEALREIRQKLEEKFNQNGLITNEVEENTESTLKMHEAFSTDVMREVKENLNNFSL